MTISLSQDSKPTNIVSDAGLRRVLRIMTPGELAAALDCPESTITGWRDRDVGPKWTRLGKRVYYRIEDVLAWIAEGVMKPKQEPSPMRSLESARADIQAVCVHDWFPDPARAPHGVICGKCHALGKLKT